MADGLDYRYRSERMGRRHMTDSEMLMARPKSRCETRCTRKETTGKLLAAARAKGLDVSAIVGEDVYGMLVKMFDEHMCTVDIAEIHGCNRQTVYSWVHGPKNSAYSKLMYWVSRK